MTNLYPRETVEFQPITVTVNGTAVTTDVDFAVVASSARPLVADWVAAYTLEGKIGVLIDTMDPGTYEVWARVTSFPETPVLQAGQIIIT